MKETIEPPDVRLYERIISGLGNAVIGKTQYWQVDTAKVYARKPGSRLQWPETYRLAALVESGDLTTAVICMVWARQRNRCRIQLLPPFGWKTDQQPEPNRWDVYVLPDGRVFQIVDFQSSTQIGNVPARRRQPRRRWLPRVKTKQPTRTRHRSKKPRPHRYRSRYQLERAKELIAFILIFLMTATIFGVLRRLSG